MSDAAGARACAFGEDAIYLHLDELPATERAARSHAVAALLRSRFADAQVVVGAAAIAVHGCAPTPSALALAEEAALAARSAGQALEGRSHSVQVIYDGADLAEVARALGITPRDLARAHTERDYLVELVGFLPGFGYLGPLDPRLQLPRRPTPRPSVPANSVAIAGPFTGIYPSRSPGGWNLLGRAIGFVAFDPRRAQPCLLAAGDRVRFVEAAPADFVRDFDVTDAGGAAPAVNEAGDPEIAGLLPACSIEPEAVALELQGAPAAASIQDAGRRALADGVPPSGPLDPELFAWTNQAAGNHPGAAAIEVPLGRLELVVRAAPGVVVALDGEPARPLSAGSRLVIEASARAVRYLAVRGGIDVPRVLGSRATLLSGRFGGYRGRPLRAGDRLAVGRDAALPGSIDVVASLVDSDPSEPVVLEAVAGPHLERFPPSALEQLAAIEWRVSRLGDRVGVRLEGGSIPREGHDTGLPVPMVRGAVQVSTDGTPIVLGPDHPVTGGYPVIGVLRRRAQARLARLRPGARVRLVAAGV